MIMDKQTMPGCALLCGLCIRQLLPTDTHNLLANVCCCCTNHSSEQLVR